MPLPLLGLLLLFPASALASDPTALYYFMAYQALSYTWPFLLPLFFLVKIRPKLRSYLLMLLLPLALLELADLPFQIYAGLAAWDVVEVKGLPTGYIIGRHVFALVLSLALMPGLRRLILASVAAR